MIYYKSYCHLVFFFVAFILLASSRTMLSQVVSTEFGQNSVQYEQKKWFRYQSVNFAFSYAENDEQLARYVLSVTEVDYHKLSLLFEHQLRKRIEVFIYSDYSDYTQSNIGQPRHNVNNGGVTRFITPKIKVFFNGDHNDLRKQIRKGLASVLLGKILAGTNLQEMVQNSVLMNLPQWFVKGAVAHATEDWNTQKDDQLRDVLLSGKYQNFVELAKKEPLLAGHSLFHFVSQEHSSSTVSNLLYLTRINRSVESGFLYVFGKSFYQVVGSDWFNFYSDRYNADSRKRRFPNTAELKIKIPKKALVKNVILSPQADFVAYTEHNQGVRKVILFNLQTNVQKVVFSQGEIDFSGDYEKKYPLVKWSPDNESLIVIYEKNDKVKIRYHYLDGKKKNKTKLISGIERVIDFDVLSANSIVLTGINDGHSDIYKYNKGGNVRAITNDFWDEKELAVVTLQGQKGIVFSSNRNNSILSTLNFNKVMPSASFDLFFYNLKTKSKELIRLTHTPLANERSPLAAGSNQFSYLSDQNGFYNRYVGSVDTLLLRNDKVLVLEDGTSFTANPDSSYDYLPVDSAYFVQVFLVTAKTYANTNYSRNILEHDVANGKVADLIYRKNAFHLFVRDFKPKREMTDVKKTKYRKFIEKQSGLKPLSLSTVAIKPSVDSSILDPGLVVADQNKPDLPDSIPPQDTGKIDIDNYKFQTEFDDPKEPESSGEDDSQVTPVILIEEEGEIKATKRKKNPISTISEQKTKIVDWNSTHANKYKSLFKVDQITLQMDNTPLYNGMNMYLGGFYQFQPLSFAIKSGFNDLFENFYLELGVRVPFDFNGMEYFVNVENRKGPINQKFSFYRRGRIQNYIVVDTSTNFSVEVKGRTVKHLLQSELKYPISKFHSIKGIFSLQLDKVAILAEEFISLQIPVYHENRLGLRLEYVFDNTLQLRVNAKKGTAFKAFFDMYKPFSVQTADEFRVGFEGGLTSALGFDARHYFTPDNKTIFAFRLAAAASFGEQKILYSLGGVENWIFPGTSTTISLPDSDDFGLQTLAANMRGFNSNARNGSSFAAANVEIRIPVIEYLSRNSPRNAMLRTLQFVAFIDVGTAWQGASPFSIDNPLNTSVINNNAPGVVSPVKVTVNYYRRPILFGYGFGIRTVLLGHYFKLDYAWGVETGQVQKPVLYLSIGADF